ncbi:hypothetical protein PTTG_03981 [Puccinia triticina 1-1 BBBD Race 1]|uniref:Exocyst complex component SEC5 n=1 Tax=Puccinia triticina (isolate 1-1 / race 1 (BBBD)) TaxID=630390 RepID=A0A180G9T3_PUCT1|nr:hypothetical protein PTTG_03981 [Puccinia triticina 1-1 BBBD Race 1]WAR58322.1 hypothetical protein PtB15_5B556 [Puccinia triticina]
MASGKSIEILGIDEEELLKTYRLSSLKPSKWEDIDPSTTSQDVRGLSTPNSTKFSKGEDDPLGLLRGPILADVSGDLRSTVSTTSKTFDPKAFLSTVHPNASFSDLKKGGARLRESLEQRSEALKILVESEFDRFVAVKVANEGVYEQMKAGPLRSECDYGTADLKESLRLGTSKADQVYTPLLENRKKAERLRSTLGVFERSKFFFNLPGTLIEAIEAEKYDAVLLAYKRGKNMLDSRPGQVLNLPAPSNPEQLAQQKRIFDKVWSDVEKVVNDFKLKLLTKLASSTTGSKPLEEIEKTIEIILELDPMSDPAWTFCENQYKSTMEKLVVTFKEAARKTRVITAQANSKELSEEQLIEELRGCLIAIEPTTMIVSDAVVKHAAGSEVWCAILELIRVSSQLLSKELAVYWHVVNGYLNGKYQRSDGKSRKDTRSRRLLSCKQMTNEIILRYCSLLSEFFVLSSDPNSASIRSPITQLSEFAPKYANSVQAAFYLRKLFDHLTEWVHEFMHLEIPKESLNCLTEFLESAGFKFLSTISTYWVKDAKIFHLLEDWVRPERSEDESQPVGTTMYLKRMDNFQRYMMLNSYCLSGGKEQAGLQIMGSPGRTDQSASKSKMSRSSIPATNSRKAQAAFLDGLYGFLDGLVHIAFTSTKPRPAPPETLSSSIELGFTSTSMDNETIAKGEKGNESDEEEIDIRLLLTISNLSNFTAVYIPRLFHQFSEAFSSDMTNDLETLMDVVGQLDTLLLGDYIKRKAEILSEIIQTGVLGGKVDWLTAPKPTGVNSFVYDALLTLVLVHSQVTSLVGPIPSSQSGGESLVKVVLSKLVEELAQECLNAFGSVEKFGMGGMLQATLEIEFIHRTLSAYITPEADLSMQGIYQKITSAYQRAPAQGERDGANNELQKELEALKRTLHLSRRTTALAFVCFKKPKAASSASPHEDITEPVTK